MIANEFHFEGVIECMHGNEVQGSRNLSQLIKLNLRILNLNFLKFIQIFFKALENMLMRIFYAHSSERVFA